MDSSLWTLLTIALTFILLYLIFRRPQKKKYLISEPDKFIGCKYVGDKFRKWKKAISDPVNDADDNFGGIF
jgi:hypothetical protein